MPFLYFTFELAAWTLSSTHKMFALPSPPTFGTYFLMSDVLGWGWLIFFVPSLVAEGRRCIKYASESRKNPPSAWGPLTTLIRYELD